MTIYRGSNVEAEKRTIFRMRVFLEWSFISIILSLAKSGSPAERLLSSASFRPDTLGSLWRRAQRPDLMA